MQVAALLMNMEHPEGDLRHRAAIDILTNLLHLIRENDQNVNQEPDADL